MFCCNLNFWCNLSFVFGGGESIVLISRAQLNRTLCIDTQGWILEIFNLIIFSEQPNQNRLDLNFNNYFLSQFPKPLFTDTDINFRFSSGKVSPDTFLLQRSCHFVVSTMISFWMLMNIVHWFKKCIIYILLHIIDMEHWIYVIFLYHTMKLWRNIKF